ncbi:hypothetical protein [Halorussus halophilus]|uniref:hypothetical protein n=1 Tax=Halorussus halophilus TaxID=2650975 RepID=UPI00130112EB|nr:hypothetical protein [Halorussus halophilus]
MDEWPNSQREQRVSFRERDESRVAWVNGDLIEWLLDEVGDSLCAMAVYQRNKLEFEYIRDDVRDRYSHGDFEAMAEEFGLDGALGDEHKERLYCAGELNFVVQGFDDGTFVRVPLTEYGGLFVALDRDAEVSLPEFAERLRSVQSIEFL